jgi:hypothetical protein
MKESRKNLSVVTELQKKMPLPQALTISQLCSLLPMFFFATEAFAQRDDRQFRSEDFSGEVIGASDGGVFGALFIVAIGVFVVLSFILDRYFRLFLFAYAAMIGGIIAIFEVFDKQGRIVAILVVMGALLYADRRLGK